MNYAWVRDRTVWLGVAALVVAALAAAGGVELLRRTIPYRLGDVTLADPTPELVAHYRLLDTFRAANRFGPIVTRVGPDAASLGLGDIREGDWFCIAGDDWRVPSSVSSFKRTLGRREVVRVVYVLGPAHGEKAGATCLKKIKRSSWQIAPLRPAFARDVVAEDGLLFGTALAELALLVAVYLARYRRAKSPGLLLAWLGALGAILLVTQLAVIDVLRGEVAGF